MSAPPPRRGLRAADPPLGVLEPGRRRRRLDVDELVAALIVGLAGVGLVTVLAGMVVLGVLIVRGLA